MIFFMIKSDFFQYFSLLSTYNPHLHEPPKSKFQGMPGKQEIQNLSEISTDNTRFRGGQVNLPYPPPLYDIFVGASVRICCFIFMYV